MAYRLTAQTGCMRWQQMLTRLYVTLFISTAVTLGLPMFAIVWLNFMPGSPPTDYVAESVVRFHGDISSGTFYAMIVYNLMNVIHEAVTGGSLYSRIHMLYSRCDRIHLGQCDRIVKYWKMNWKNTMSLRRPTPSEVWELEEQMDYQYMSIVFLKDALDEANAAREEAETRVVELQRQINAQNQGIEQMAVELVQKKSVEQRDAREIESLRHEIKRLSSLQGNGSSGNDLSRKDMRHAIELRPQYQSPRPSPLNDWRSHPKMFLTARIKPTRADDLEGELAHVSSVELQTDGLPLVVLQDPQTGTKSRHQFDYCFGPQDTNDTIWNEYHRLLIGGFTENYIVAIATDGPSGSGKTFTMFKGKNALISTTIFNLLQHESNDARALQLRAVEIYKNEAIDVVHKLRRLDKTLSPPRLHHRGHGVWKDFQVLEFPGNSTLDFITNKTLMLNTQRTNKDTAMNTSHSSHKGGSSRGHLVVILTHGDVEHNNNAGRLIFIDLAGTEERGVNDHDADAEYDDIRKDRSDCYVFFKNFARNPITYGDRTLTKLLKVLLRQPNKTTKIAHIFHISTTDHDRNMLMMRQKKELEQGNVDGVHGVKERARGPLEG